MTSSVIGSLPFAHTRRGRRLYAQDTTGSRKVLQKERGSDDMGGRGAASGMSDKGNKYGTQYHTVLESGNIKFVTKNARDAETLMETMTRGRVYVTVGGDELQSITYFDNGNKRAKSINLNHPHIGMQPHTHHGYFHNENDGKKGAANLTPEEKKMVERITKLWHNHLSGR